MSNQAFTRVGRSSYAASVTLDPWHGRERGGFDPDDDARLAGGSVGAMMDPAEPLIAVVGGGAAAVAAILAWQQVSPDMRPGLLWVAPAGATGAGVAYATSDPQHRLNVRARRMSAINALPDDFVEFLRARDGHVDPDGFYPRADYGSYLQTRLRAALAQSDLESWPTIALEVQEIQGAWQILGGDGKVRRVEALVLAPGSLPPRSLRGVAPDLHADGRYQVDPWQFPVTPLELPRRPEIFIVGSGLTAVDLALSAAQRHPDARIHMLSRHGVLPAVQSRAEKLPAATAAHLFARLESSTRLSDWLHAIRACMREVADWRSVMESLRQNTAYLWSRLSVPERLRFLRHLRWAWDAARHRMAPEIDRQLCDLRAQGRLSVHAGRLLSVRGADAGAVVVACRPRGSDITRLHRAELVLQACGLETRAGLATNALINGLLAQGSARVDALGLGLAVAPDNGLLDANGHRHANAWLLGALARGSLWECTAMPDIRAQAEDLIAKVTARLMTARVLAGKIWESGAMDQPAAGGTAYSARSTPIRGTNQGRSCALAVYRENQLPEQPGEH